MPLACSPSLAPACRCYFFRSLCSIAATACIMRCRDGGGWWGMRKAFQLHTYVAEQILSVQVDDTQQRNGIDRIISSSKKN